jgi:uncharacterized protein YjbI with pentapeptide repeats
MPSDEHVALIRKGAAAWNAWRNEGDEAPDLSRAGLRGLDLSGFNLSRADLQGADLRGTNLSQANLSSANLEGRTFSKQCSTAPTLADAFLHGAQFLNCAQLVLTRNWQSAFRDKALACGEAIPGDRP